ASSASADPTAVTARTVEASGRPREVELTSEKDLTAPLVESSALDGRHGSGDPQHPPQRVALLADGAAVADGVETARGRSRPPGGRAGASGRARFANTAICCDAHPFSPVCASPSITRRCMRMNRIRIGAIAIREAAIITG